MSEFLQGFLGLFGRKKRRRAGPDAGPGRQPHEEWIPLPEAVQLMYDELAGTQWRTEADREPTPEARLDRLAMSLIHHAPIEGRSPPSSTYRRIPEADFGAGVFKGGGKNFQRQYESYLTFIDMRVRAADLREALARMKARG